MKNKWLFKISILSVALVLSILDIFFISQEPDISPTIAPVITFEPFISPSPTEYTSSQKSNEVINMNTSFFQSEISDSLYQKINNKSYKKNSTIPLEDLRYIEVLHYGFDNKVHKGELIVNRKIADDVINIFKELYDEKYPIEKIILIDEYDGDDIKSMEDNNSSAFNFRVIDGTSKLSNHAMGFAIDINPLYNPYVRTVNGIPNVLPENGTKYADRSMDCRYYITKNSICYDIFKKYGFDWGGDWKSSKDYQHFQKIAE